MLALAVQHREANHGVAVDAIQVVSGGKIPAAEACWPARRLLRLDGMRMRLYRLIVETFLLYAAELAALLGQITTSKAPALLALAAGENRSSIDGNICFRQPQEPAEPAPSTW